MIKVKSIYSKAHAEDGERILVDLFWPEGLMTREAHVDEWVTDLGPSYDLQRFHYDVSNWQSYKSKYIDEILSIKEKKQLLQKIAAKSKDATVTLLFGNKDSKHNHASVLKELIESELNKN